MKPPEPGLSERRGHLNHRVQPSLGPSPPVTTSQGAPQWEEEAD